MKEEQRRIGELTSALPTADDQWWLVGNVVARETDVT
jgi:hypothetical protein